MAPLSAFAAGRRDQTAHSSARRQGASRTPTRRLASAVVTVTVALALIPGTASASPYNRGCGKPSEGFLLTDQAFEVHGPWYVKMSAATANSIARRILPEEFGLRVKGTQVPCGVGENVAEAAANARLHWSSNDGTVGARWIGYSRGPYFGLFHCTGTGTGVDSAIETCIHFADRHAGTIRVAFTISLNPYNTS